MATKPKTITTDLQMKNAKPDPARGKAPTAYKMPPLDMRGASQRFLVYPTGNKSTETMVRIAGGKQKKMIHSYPEFGYAAVRKIGNAALVDAKRGVNPAERKQVEKQQRREGVDLIENRIDDFLIRHAKAKRTLPEMRRIFDTNVLPVLNGRRIQDITKRDLRDLLDDIVDRPAPVMANRTYGLLRNFFSWSANRDDDFVSPMANMKKPAPEAERTRDHVVADSDLARIWKAAEHLAYPFGPMVQLIMLTGARRAEIAGLRWSEIDFDERVWRLPGARSKNGHPNLIPLSGAFIEILDALPRIIGDFVFTTTGETHSTGYSRSKHRLAKIIAADGGEPIEPWTLHDLRRSVATGMQRLGIAPHIVEAVLNHRDGIIRGVAATYSRYRYDPEKASALDAWARHLRALIAGEAANVVALTR